MRSGARNLLYTLIGLGLLALLLYRSRGFFRPADFNWAKLLQTVRGANLYLLILCVVTIYACYAIRALRWQLFQRNLGSSRFWPIYSMTLAGFAAIFLLGRAGEPVRPLLLARKEKLPVADMFGIYLLERLFDFGSMAVIAAIGSLLFKARADSGDKARAVEIATRTGGVILSVGVLIAIGALVYLKLHGTSLLEKRLQVRGIEHGWKARTARIFLGCVRGVQTIRTWGELWLAVSYSMVHWVLVLMIYLWVSASFGGTLATIGLSGAMLLLAITLTGSVVQLPTIGGGSQAAAMIAYTEIFRVEKESALVAAIMLWLITFVVCSLAGVPLLIREGLSLGELRKMAVREEK
jgi:glycosyltransferase 2 family protein